MPLIARRPWSPIRHTYTGAEARSDSATTDDAPEAALRRLGFFVAAFGVALDALLAEFDFDPPPYLISATISSTMTTMMTPTAAM